MPLPYTMLDAIVSTGFYKGWPLGMSMRITEGMNPKEAKRLAVENLRRLRAETDLEYEQAIAAIEALPDVIGAEP